MKNAFLLLAFISLLSCALQAQTNDSIYSVLTTFDGSCTGPLIENVPGQYIRLKAPYGECRFDYKYIKEIRNANDELVYPTNNTGQALATTRLNTSGANQHNLLSLNDTLFCTNPAYKNWYKAFLINGNDTVPVKIEEKKDYSYLARIATPSMDATISDQSAAVIYKDGTYKKLQPLDIHKLVIFSSDKPIEYLARFNTVYLVLVDGPCQLLATTVHETSTRTSLNYGPGGMNLSYNYDVEKDLTDYCAFYKDRVWNLYTKKQMLITSNSAGFKKNCLELVADCPAVYDKVKHGNYNHENLEQMIKDFNQCIEGKGK